MKYILLLIITSCMQHGDFWCKKLQNYDETAYSYGIEHWQEKFQNEKFCKKEYQRIENDLR